MSRLAYFSGSVIPDSDTEIEVYLADGFASIVYPLGSSSHSASSYGQLSIDLHSLEAAEALRDAVEEAIAHLREIEANRALAAEQAVAERFR